jgi:AraC family transcriptional regulator
MCEERGMNSDAIDSMMSRRFRLKNAPTLAAPTPSKAPIAFTRLRCDSAEHGRAGPVPAENSFAFQVLLRPIRSWEIWTDRGHVSLPPSGPGDIFLFDLSENPRLELHDPFDMVRFYISQSTLDSLACEHDLPHVAGLRTPGSGTVDPVMHGMALALTGSMHRPHETQTTFVEHMALAFHAHVTHAYGGGPQTRRHSGGLTSWQLRRARNVMLSELNANHSISRLASECGLSTSHFARAFKEATGLAPHQWLMRRRVERARELLAQSSMELADIALACGFVDQSHFSRVFVSVEKLSPGRWRRQLAR